MAKHKEKHHLHEHKAEMKIGKKAHHSHGDTAVKNKMGSDDRKHSKKHHHKKHHGK